jgi:serine/threonine protein kinase
MSDETVSHDSEQGWVIADLFARAGEMPADRWETFLWSECPEHPGVRHEVLRALRGQARAGDDFLATVDEPSTSIDPDRIGKYEVVRRFTQPSGQADAFLGYDPDLRRHVVLKRYLGAGTPEGRRLMIEEGRALASVKSPHVAECLGIEMLADDQDAFLVVEQIKGRNLAEVRRDGPLAPLKIIDILTQLAAGVAEVHKRGLIHRDIKPANVILGDDGRPRLVDFGLATHLGGDRLRELSGTPAYMAPEQARREPERIDFRTDVFGLGTVLYALLTGRPPYIGDTKTEVLARAAEGVYPAPRELDATIPAPLEAVCLKAMEPAPNNRHATALEFAAALRQAMEPAPVKPPRPARRSSWDRRGLAAAAVLACGLLAPVAWRLTDSNPTTSVVTPPTSVATPPNPSVAPAKGALRADITVTHFKDLGDGRKVERIGPISEASLASDPLQLNDLVRARVTLSRPAYAYLIALNPDGKDQLCLPSTGAAASRADLEFPENPQDYFSLTDGAGLQAFVVVASDEPLPAYEDWKATLPNGLAWAHLERQGLWIYDGAEAAGDEGRSRGEIVRREAAPEPLINLCDRLRHAPGVTLVRALAFPVQPDHLILK